MEHDSARAKRKKRRKRTQRTVTILAIVLAAAGIFSAWMAIRSVTNRRNINPDPIETETTDTANTETAGTEETYRTTEEVLEDTISEIIAEMPIEDKIAQLFIVTPTDLTGEAYVTSAGETLHTALNGMSVGGIVYDDGNFIDETQITSMLAVTKDMSRYPLFLLTAEQGGEKSALANALQRSALPSASQIGESGDPDAALSAGSTIGTYVKETGFNAVIGPCANIGTTSDVYGEEAQLAGEYAVNFYRGLRDAGVMSIVCDFPVKPEESYGGVRGVAQTRRSLAELQDAEFLPFRACITAGCEAVMLSNMAAPRVTDDDIPLSLSGNLIMGQLRSTIGFQGIVITGALNEDAVTGRFSAAQAALNAFDAGADMLYLPEDFHAAYEALLGAANEGQITGERIDTSLRRIFRVKYREGFF